MSRNTALNRMAPVSSSSRMHCKRGRAFVSTALSARPACRGKKKAMSAQVARKLTDADMWASFCVHKNSPQARMIRAAPVPMGAAYSPSPSASEPMFSIPPLRRVSSMALDIGTDEASHSGMAV